MLKTPEIGAVKSPPIPAQLAQQLDSGLCGIDVEPSVAFTVAGVAVLPSAADALIKDDVHLSHTVNFDSEVPAVQPQ